MSGKGKDGARAKLRAHFLSNLGRVMDSEELRAVAGGISEWARRVRELRRKAQGVAGLTRSGHTATRLIPPSTHPVLASAGAGFFVFAVDQHHLHLYPSPAPPALIRLAIGGCVTLVLSTAPWSFRSASCPNFSEVPARL